MNRVNLEAIDDFLNKPGEYSREIYQLRPKKFYIKPDALDNKLHEYLRPHSLYYYSPMNSFFLFEIKSLDMLNLYFDFFLARDGLLSTLKFFYKYPTPEKAEARILINKKFAPIVPKAWSSQIAFYSPCLASNDPALVKKPTALYFTATIDAAQFSLKNAAAQIEKMKAFYGSDWDSIPKYCLSFKTMYMGEEDIASESSLNFDFLKSLFEATDGQVNFVSWNDLKDHSLNGSVYHDFDDHQMLYGDSFIHYHFLFSGALPFEIEQYENMGSTEGRIAILSQNHGHLITNQYPENYQQISEDLKDEWDFLREFVLSNEAKLERDEDTEYDEARLCTPEFVSFAQYLAKKYLSL